MPGREMLSKTLNSGVAFYFGCHGLPGNGVEPADLLLSVAWLWPGQPRQRAGQAEGADAPSS
jgi:hypothetical protein